EPSPLSFEPSNPAKSVQPAVLNGSTASTPSPQAAHVPQIAPVSAPDPDQIRSPSSAEQAPPQPGDTALSDGFIPVATKSDNLR
ncbi:MAG TPA: hypothetical protein PKM25_10345, partial [Candidatus Ozemobacteraceae bacterium]|nr:hypothetical protein [Candidatus Ozemobacteraceae bacterium]